METQTAMTTDFISNEMPKALLLKNIASTYQHQESGTSNSSSSSDDSQTQEIPQTLDAKLNKVTLELYKQTAKGVKSPQGSLVVCPVSVVLLLITVLTGARGKTAQEIRAMLGINVPIVKEAKKEKESFRKKIKKLTGISSQDDDIITEEIHELVKVFLEKLAIEAPTALKISNGVFPSKVKNASVTKSFQKAVQEYLAAKVEALDYEDIESACSAINKWISRETGGKITDVVSSCTVASDTSVVLVNTTYFNGKWSEKFDPEMTHERDFTTASNTVVRIPFMTKKATFGYYESSDLNCQCLQMTCENGKFLFKILLPNETDGLKNLEETITLDKLEALSKDIQKKEVVVYLPKFTLEKTIDMKKVVRELGVHEVFERTADLSGMDGKGKHFVSDMIHKVYFNVTEEGAEAAAATACMVRAAGITTKKKTVFEANHPFLFLIHEVSMGTILFIGKFCDVK